MGALEWVDEEQRRRYAVTDDLQPLTRTDNGRAWTREVRGYGITAMCRKIRGQHEELDTLRAERDRLREELEKYKLALSAWQKERATRQRDETALATENAGLREKLTSKEWRAWVLRECARYDNHQHAGNYGMGGGTPGDGASIVFDEIDLILSSPSPLTAAVQRVLEAVGVHEGVAERWAVALEASSMSEMVGSPLYYEFSRAKDEVSAAHDALQALLEGKGEG